MRSDRAFAYLSEHQGWHLKSDPGDYEYQRTTEDAVFYTIKYGRKKCCFIEKSTTFAHAMFARVLCESRYNPCSEFYGCKPKFVREGVTRPSGELVKYSVEKKLYEKMFGQLSRLYIHIYGYEKEAA